jgi:hypothetical protein
MFTPLRNPARCTAHGLAFALVVLLSGVASATPCGTGLYPFPYTDVAGVADPFCPGIMEAYVTGVSKGTTPTTFSPSDNVNRTQMTTFLQRSLDQGLRRNANRAALNQWWTSTSVDAMQSVASAGNPENCTSDGEYVYISNTSANTVTQVSARTGTVLGTWTGIPAAGTAIAAAGRVFVVSPTNPGAIYMIDPTQAPGAMTLAATGVGTRPVQLAFDGARLWATNNPNPPTGNGGVSIITVQATTPYPVTHVSAGLGDLNGIAYDGKNIWVADRTANSLHKLDSSGAILQTVALGLRPIVMVYDGANLWVTHGVPSPGSVTVVQASTGAIVANIPSDASNGINIPQRPSFDGERVIVPSYSSNSVALFKAADLSLIAKVDLGAGAGPTGTCNDGVNFWITLSDQQRAVRF